ncbi:tetratricopeptide repeat protein [Candidatus Parabeggiatoa sp. HSG14]|uniref:tetratricopeptide repeat protein n=1 Tax=Candidatus Parabeggiatoa sp. HSG14 TaxID=3055593 RepID=UPI0025A8A763|nr:tetratricopeptide repeat protein [Thiotrichales bacterium HSG14]
MKLKLFWKNIGVIIFANFLIGCAGQVTNGEAIAQEIPLLENIQNPPHFLTLKPSFFVSSQQEYMYKILVAELAKLRGHHLLAAKYFFDIATQFRDVRLAERATRRALYAEKYNLATQAARLWVELEPNNPNVRKILGELLLKQNKIEEAVVHLDAMINSLKDDPRQLKSVLESILEQHKDSDFALNLMEKLVIKRPNDSVVLLLYSRLLLRAKQLNKALDVLRTLLNRVPDHADAVPLYAYILGEQNQKSLALQWMEQALYKYPKQPEWRLMYARMLAEDGQFKKSIKQFEMLLSQYPQHGDILYALGVLSLQTKQQLTAKKYFKVLVKNGIRLNAARYYLGQIAQDEKNLDKALFWYQQINGGANYLNAQMRVTVILAQQGQLDRALEHLKTVSVDNREDAISLLQLEAELLVEQKQYHRALDAYNRALKLKSDNIELLYLRALLSEKMNLMDQLERDLRYLLKLEPGNVNALNALGYSLADKTDRYKEAYRLIKRALVLSPDDHYILDSMGWVLYKMGKYIQAIAYLRKARVNQNDPEIAAHLGEVLWNSGDQQSAIDVWEEAQIDFPDNRKLRNVMRHFLPQKQKKQKKGRP